MLRTPRTGLVVATVLLLSATAGHTVEQGRLLLKILDAEGKPLAGATVTVTCEQLPRYHQEKTSKKKGTVTVAFGDATKIYHISITAEGYRPAEANFKPTIGKTEQRTIPMETYGGSSAPAASGVPGLEVEGELTLLPAEKVFNEGVEASQAGDYEAARDKFLEALEVDPELKVAHFALGGVYLELGEFESAIASADRVLEVEPGNPGGYRILYEAHSRLGHEQEARQALQTLSELDQEGDAAAMIYNEGQASLQVGDLKTAKQRFAEALGLDPDLTPARWGLAVALMSEKSYTEAAATAEQVLAVEPDNLGAKMMAFDAYEASGDAAGQQRAYDRLLATGSSAVASQFYHRGETRFDSGDLGGAARQFERALEMDPSQAKAHYYLGLCYINQGAAAKATDHLQKFIELAPDDPDATTAAEMVQSLAG